MKPLKRGDSIYLDSEGTKKSRITSFLDCRDGTVEVYEYVDDSGYGSKVRLFLCQDAKHEVCSIIRQTQTLDREWVEEEMVFDFDSFLFLKALINGEKQQIGGSYSLVRDFSTEK